MGARVHRRELVRSRLRVRWALSMRPSDANDPTPRIETRSGLPPWSPATLPEPPRPTGFGWLQAVGPGVIVLGVSIGGGGFLPGPAAFVRHGLSLLWVVGIAVCVQTVFNT